MYLFFSRGKNIVRLRFSFTEERCLLIHCWCFRSMANLSYTEVANPMLAYLLFSVRPEQLVEPTLSRGFLPALKLLGRSARVKSSSSKIEWAVGQRVVG